MSKNQRNRLRMLSIKQLTQLLRICPLQLGQISLFRFLRPPDLRHQVFCALLSECIGKQSARIVDASMNNEALGFKKFPEFLHHRSGYLWRNTPDVGKVARKTLNIRFWKTAENLFCQILSHSHQQYGSLTRST